MTTGHSLSAFPSRDRKDGRYTPADDDLEADDLRPAQGILFGLLAGCVVWACLILLFVHMAQGFLLGLMPAT